MKILRAIAILIFFTTFSIGEVAADFLIEPMLGDELAFETKTRSGRIENESSRILWGLTWAGRVGYVFDGFQVGLEMGESDLMGEEDDKDASDTGKVRIYEQGYFAAYQMETLRFWITGIYYAFIADRSEFTGTGYKLGAGIYFWRGFMINLEYTSRQFSRETVGEILTIDDSIQSLIFTVSYPFIF